MTLRPGAAFYRVIRWGAYNIRRQDRGKVFKIKACCLHFLVSMLPGLNDLRLCRADYLAGMFMNDWMLDACAPDFAFKTAPHEQSPPPPSFPT